MDGFSSLDSESVTGSNANSRDRMVGMSSSNTSMSVLEMEENEMVQRVLDAWIEEEGRDRQAEEAGEGEQNQPPRKVEMQEGAPEPIWGNTNTTVVEGRQRLDEEDDDPLTFLCSVFPRKKPDVLRSRLQQCDSLETLLEELLNEDFIAHNHSSPSASTSNSPPAGPRPNSKQRRRLKTNNKASFTLSLTSPTPLSSSSQPRLIDPSLSTLPTSFTTTPSQASANHWINLDSTSIYLSSLLSLTPGRITTVYHQQSCSLPLTLNFLLHSLSERPSASIADFDAIVGELGVLLPSVGKGTLEVLVKATNGDVSNALDLWEFVKRTEKDQGGLMENGLVGFGRDEMRGEMVVGLGGGGGRRGDVARSMDRVRLGELGKGKERDWNVITRSRVELAHGSSPSIEECQTRITAYEKKRNEAFRSAARCFQSGNKGNRGAAWYWAEVGREMDREKRRWEKLEGWAIVGERRCVPLFLFSLVWRLRIVQELIENRRILQL